jgi:hypothetical protein
MFCGRFCCLSQLLSHLPSLRVERSMTVMGMQSQKRPEENRSVLSEISQEERG